MTALSNTHVEMDQKYMAYMSASAHGKRARKVEKLRKAVVEAISESKYKASGLPFYKGDKSLRQSHLDYIQMCYLVFNDDYEKIVNMEEIAEQSFDEMEAYLLLREKTVEKLKMAGDKLQAEVRAFAAKHDVELIETKSALGEKMALTGAVNHYYNKVYLLFFKCNWQHNQMIEALNQQKVNAVEQARSSLVRFATEGLAVLDTMKGYNMDKSLVLAGKHTLQLYKRAAETEIPKMIEFLVKKENFAKMDKAMKSKSSPSQEEIDAFNKEVKDYNASIKVYNTANDSSNKLSNEAYNSWEKAVKEFYDRHVPHYK